MKYSVQQIEQALKDGRSIQYVTSQNEQFSGRLNCCTNQVVFLKCLLKCFERNIWICTKIEGEETVEQKPHKHAELIKKWADGAIIQYKDWARGEWVTCTENKPTWNEQSEYRVKPMKFNKWKWVCKTSDNDLFITNDYYTELEVYKNFNVIQKIYSTMIEVEG